MSLVSAALMLITFCSGLLYANSGCRTFTGLLPMQVHVNSALATVGLLWEVHVWDAPAADQGALPGDLG